jgi:hypothetical protein
MLMRMSGKRRSLCADVTCAAVAWRETEILDGGGWKTEKGCLERRQEKRLVTHVRQKSDLGARKLGCGRTRTKDLAGTRR